MKLYIWNECDSNYTSGIAFAIAESEEEARKLVEEDYRKNGGYLYPSLRGLSVHSISKRIGRAEPGGG